MIQKRLVLLLAILIVNIESKCIHDEIQSKIKVGKVPELPPIDKQISKNSFLNLNSQERMMQTTIGTVSLQSNLTITFVYDSMTGMNSGVLTYVKNTMIPYAQGYFSKLLKVYSTRNYDFTGVTSCQGVSVPSAYQSRQQTDYIMLVTTNTAVGTGVIGTCGYCHQASTTNRPVMGLLTLYNDIFNGYNTNLQKTFESVSTTMIHEILHCLGFSSAAFGQFYDPINNVALAQSAVVQTGTLRGKTATYLIMPSLLTYARSYFNCPSLVGVEMEDEGGTGTAGSHWERRVVPEDLMIGVDSMALGMTNFTLAFLEGTGWYTISTKLYAHQAQTGKNAGCNFVNNVCVGSGQVIQDSDNFCNVASQTAPTQNAIQCGVCTLGTTTSATLASYFNYYGSNTVAGTQLNDNCPIVLGSSNYYCYMADQAPAAGSTQYYAQYFGDSSFCIMGTWVTTAYQATSHQGCLRVSCVNSGGVTSARVYITSTYYVTCTSTGTVITLDTAQGYTGTITCPNIQKVCTTYTYQNYQVFANSSYFPYDNVATGATPSNTSTPNTPTNTGGNTAQTKLSFKIYLSISTLLLFILINLII